MDFIFDGDDTAVCLVANDQRRNQGAASRFGEISDAPSQLQSDRRQAKDSSPLYLILSASRGNSARIACWIASMALWSAGREFSFRAF